MTNIYVHKFPTDTPACRLLQSKVVNGDMLEALPDSDVFLEESGGKSADPGPDQPLDRSPPRCDSPRPQTPVHHGRGAAGSN